MGYLSSSIKISLMFTDDVYLQREIFQKLLLDIRKEKGITQVELANKLEVPQSFVSKYESGERKIDLIELNLICNALGIALQDFVKQFINRLSSK